MNGQDTQTEHGTRRNGPKRLLQARVAGLLQRTDNIDFGENIERERGVATRDNLGSKAPTALPRTGCCIT